MIIRAPLPDEPLRAFIGRMKRHNVCSSDSELFCKLAKCMSIADFSTTSVNPIELLSHAYGVEQSFLIRQHSMLPFTRLVGKFDREGTQGADFLHERYVRSALRNKKIKAYLCPECVAEDLRFRGITYWRRVHQLPGIDWCTKHENVLRISNEINALEQSPLSALNSSQPLNEKQAIEARDHPLVNCYARIAEGVLSEVSRSNHVEDVSVLIREWARAQDLRVSLNGKRYLLSDRVTSSFPRPWLTSLIPASVNKKAREFASSIDGTWYSRSNVSSTSAYLLALALMYESSDDALNALASLKPVAIPRKSAVHRQPGAWKSIDVVTVWMKHFGHCPSIANDLNLSQHYVRKRLYEVGLPVIRSKAGAALKSAIQKYWAGDSLHTACASSGTKQTDVEGFLRVATALHLGEHWSDTEGSSSADYEALLPPTRK
ncbi:TniQ family protein [Comamonas testosteroni]|uniref:TniQ family protein n=1 Tax=Comamonas testosteroni TaxID=285 RepID=UPI00391B63F6